MNDCIDRPDTRLHPTNASEAQFATCNAGAIHTGQAGIHPSETLADIAFDKPLTSTSKTDRCKRAGSARMFGKRSFYVHSG